MTSLRWATAFVASTCVLLSCNTPADQVDRSEVTVTDSAGVQLVLNSGPDWPLELREVLRVGTLDGDPNLQFYRITDIQVDSIEGFWVVDSHESIRHYDADGSYKGFVGGRGEGPGEVERYQIVRLGDHSVLALGTPAALQLFSPSGEYLGGRSARSPTRSFLIPIGYDGTRWLFGELLGFACTPGLFRQEQALVVANPTEADLTELRRVPGEIMQVLSDGPGCAGVTASYFYGNPSYTTDGSGRFFASDTLVYRIEVGSAEGQVQRIIQRTVSRRAFSSEWRSSLEVEVAREWEARYTAPGQGLDMDIVAELVDRGWPQDPPPHVPPIAGSVDGALWVSTDGYLWVLRGDTHPDPGVAAAAHVFGYMRINYREEWLSPSVFDVFDPTGVYIGTAETPPEFAPMSVTRSRLYGRITDDLDVEYVVAYEIVVGG